MKGSSFLQFVLLLFGFFFSMPLKHTTSIVRVSTFFFFFFFAVVSAVFGSVLALSALSGRRRYWVGRLMDQLISIDLSLLFLCVGTNVK
jgi:hypothetical protein